MDLCDLPFFAFRRVIEHSVIAVGLYKAVRLRIVSKAFDEEVTRAVFETRIFSFAEDDQVNSRLLLLSSKNVARRLKAMIRKPHMFAYNKLTHSIQFQAKKFLGENHTHEDYLAYASTLCDAAAMELSKYGYLADGQLSYLEAGESTQIERYNFLLSARQVDPHVDFRNSIAAATSLGLPTQVTKLLEGATASDLSSYFFGHPLVIAAHCGKVSTLTLLLSEVKKSKNIHTEAVYLDAAEAASSAGQSESLKIILASIDFNQSALDEISQSAARSGHFNVFQWLSQHLSEKQQKDTDGRALVEASSKGQIEFVQTLLESDSRINITGYNKERALFYAAQGGYARLVHFFMQCGVRVSWLLDGDPAAAAATNGHIEVLRVLADNQAHLSTEVSYSEVFDCAAGNGETSTLRFLIAYGVNVHKQDIGQHALLCAAKGGHEDTVRFLASLGIPLNGDAWTPRYSPVLGAHKCGQERIVKVLLALGADEVDLEDSGCDPDSDDES